MAFLPTGLEVFRVDMGKGKGKGKDCFVMVMVMGDGLMG